MIKINKILLLLVLFCCLTSCKKDTTKELPEVKKPVKVHKKDGVLITSKPFITNATKTSANYKMLQGKWQNTSDSKSETEFKDDFKMDTYSGIGQTAKAQFLLSDGCTIISYPVKFDCIVLVNEQFCYQIKVLNSTNLEISFSGTEQSIRYKKK